jgi:hypothetical protein
VRPSQPIVKEDTTPFLQCILCGKRCGVSQTNYSCAHCGNEHENLYGNMEISYDFNELTSVAFPIQPFTIFEGNTPLVRVESLNEI